MLRYRIKYTWPDGKVRYRRAGGLCQSPDEAEVFTLLEASRIMKLSRDARLVWDVVTTKERINDPHQRRPRRRAD